LSGVWYMSVCFWSKPEVSALLKHKIDIDLSACI